MPIRKLFQFMPNNGSFDGEKESNFDIEQPMSYKRQEHIVTQTAL